MPSVSLLTGKIQLYSEKHPREAPLAQPSFPESDNSQLASLRLCWFWWPTGWSYTPWVPRTHRPLFADSPALRISSQAQDLQCCQISSARGWPCPVFQEQPLFSSRLSVRTWRWPTFFYRCVPQEDVFSMALGQHHSQTVGRAENPRPHHQQLQVSVPVHILPFAKFMSSPYPWQVSYTPSPLFPWPYKLSPLEGRQHFYFFYQLFLLRRTLEIL